MNLKEYKDWLDLNRDSENTKESYYFQVNKFLEFSKGEINQSLINDYLKTKLNNHNTFNVVRSALESYIKFNKLNIELPKSKKINEEILNFLTVEQLNDILKYPSLIFRDYEKITLMLEFMFYTGLRVEEVASLKLEDIDFDKQLITIKNTKGKKDRVVPLYSKVLNDLKILTEKFPNETVFNIQKRQIERIFSDLHTQCQLKIKNFHPHLMRYSFAVYCWSKGLDIYTIKELMGHRDIKTTERYLKAVITQDMILNKCEVLR